MVGWQRNLQTIIRQFGKRTTHTYTSTANFSSSWFESSLAPGEFPYLQRLWKLPAANVSRPFYRYLQESGISSSRKLLVGASDEKPIPSPLTPTLALSSGKSERQKPASKPAKVQAVLKDIKQSPKKVNLVAALIRGMRVEDALLQLQVTVKRASKTVYQVVHSARANATHNHGLEADRLLVAEAFVGKGYFKKRISYHAKGKCGIKERPECRLTVVVRETTPEEEAEIAKLKVSNFKKLTKRENRLVPHKLIETTPIWNRKSRTAHRETSKGICNGRMEMGGESCCLLLMWLYCNTCFAYVAILVYVFCLCGCIDMLYFGVILLWIVGRNGKWLGYILGGERKCIKICVLMMWLY